MAFEIPLRSDVTNYEFTITLENVLYGFQFNWNERMQRWTFSIYDEEGSPIVEGQPVISGFLSLDQFKDTRLPQGKLLFTDTSGENIDPGKEDLGERVFLGYLETTDL